MPLPVSVPPWRRPAVFEANANVQPSRHPLAINPSFMHSELLRLVSSRLASVLHRLASPCLALLYAPCVAFPESSLAAVAVSIHWPSRGAPQTGSTRRLSLPETPSSHSLVSSRLLFSCSAAGAAASEKRGQLVLSVLLSSRPGFAQMAPPLARSLAMIKSIHTFWMGWCYCNAMPDSYYAAAMLIQAGYMIQPSMSTCISTHARDGLRRRIQ